MKYVEEIIPGERQHSLILSDSECKVILEMASMFYNDAILESRNGTRYRPSSQGFSTLCGLMEIRNSIDFTNSSLGNNWDDIDLLDTEALKK
jgi:hypothetical protein